MTTSPLEDLTLEALWRLFPIILEEHHPEYEVSYAEQEAALLTLLGKETIRRISHIGSTAVQGLLAKPTVDILLEVTDASNQQTLIEQLTIHGWLLMSETREPYWQLSFNKGYTPQGFAEKVYHLHVREYGDWDELYFRDYLRVHPEAVKFYAQLKKELYPSYQYDRDGYTKSKTPFIKAHSQLARQEFPGRYAPQKAKE